MQPPPTLTLFGLFVVIAISVLVAVVLVLAWRSC